MESKNSDTIWTLDEDPLGWSSWAENMAQAPASSMMQNLIEAHKTSRQGWALDLGCGTGRAFLPLAEAGYKVIGVDPTARCVQYSRQRASQAHLDANPTLAAAAQLPIRSQAVDLVLAISCLFHLSHMELTSSLQEIHRVLAPEGIAILHFLDLEDWRCTLARQIQPGHAPVPSFRVVVTCFCSGEKIQQWIAQTGLKLEKMDLQATTTEHGEQRNWLTYCRKTAP
jgi:ubiquinone/menaquinone biosynthesis C-methylase UbiE